MSSSTCKKSMRSWWKLFRKILTALMLKSGHLNYFSELLIRSDLGVSATLFQNFLWCLSLTLLITMRPTPSMSYSIARLAPSGKTQAKNRSQRFKSSTRRKTGHKLTTLARCQRTLAETQRLPQTYPVNLWTWNKLNIAAKLKNDRKFLR